MKDDVGCGEYYFKAFTIGALTFCTAVAAAAIYITWWNIT